MAITTDDEINKIYESQAGTKWPVIEVLKSEGKTDVTSFVFCMFEGEKFQGHIDDVNASSENILDKAAALAECIENLAYSIRVYYEISGGLLGDDVLQEIKRDPGKHSWLGSGKFFSDEHPGVFKEAKAKREKRHGEYAEQEAELQRLKEQSQEE